MEGCWWERTARWRILGPHRVDQITSALKFPIIPWMRRTCRRLHLEPNADLCAAEPEDEAGLPRSISPLTSSVCPGRAVRPTTTSREYLWREKWRFAVAARLGSSWTSLARSRPDAMLEARAPAWCHRETAPFYSRAVTAAVNAAAHHWGRGMAVTWLNNPTYVFFYQWRGTVPEFYSNKIIPSCVYDKRATKPAALRSTHKTRH